jgi:hypothetical protein
MNGRCPLSLGGACGASRRSNTSYCNNIGNITLFSFDDRVRVHYGAVVELQLTFFSFPSSFLSPRFGFHANPSKKNVSCQFIFVLILILILFIDIYFAFNTF